MIALSKGVHNSSAHEIANCFQIKGPITRRILALGEISVRPSEGNFVAII